MDPRGHNQGLSRYASHILQFKPGTDVALLNAMLNVIVEEKLFDVQYVQAHTEGFDALTERVRAFTPEKMEPVCGVDAASFVRLPGSTPAPKSRSSSGAWASRSIRTAPTTRAA